MFAVAGYHTVVCDAFISTKNIGIFEILTFENLTKRYLTTLLVLKIPKIPNIHPQLLAYNCLDLVVMDDRIWQTKTNMMCGML